MTHIAYDGRAAVTWKGDRSEGKSTPATPALLRKELYLKERCRTGNRYQNQRNYHGQYYFSQTQSHVWYESLLEANMLMLLDWRESITAIATQPIKLTFSDGKVHYPDFLAFHSDGRQVMYDVKPASRLSERALEQFAKTRAVCEAVTWEYEILTGLPEVEHKNLTWLSHFRHPGFEPTPQALERLRDALGPGGLSVREAAQALEPRSIPRGRAGIHRLLWTAPSVSTSLRPSPTAPAWIGATNADTGHHRNHHPDRR